MYNNSGVVFGLSSIRAGDMLYQYGLGKTYNDYAFSQKDGLMFAASTTGGVDVYVHPADDYLYTIKPNTTAKRLEFHHGLIMIYSVNGKHYLEHMTDVELGLPIIEDSVFFDFEEEEFYEFYRDVTDVPIDTFFAFAFDQMIKLAKPASISMTGPSGAVQPCRHLM